MRASKRKRWIAVLGILAFAALLPASPPPPPNAAWDKLKTLVGDWKGAYAGAGEGEDHAARSRIKLDVVTRTFDRADGDCIDDQPRFRARLDREESPDFVQHRHS